MPSPTRGVDRPYVVLSVAASLDGYIDDAGPDRLILSGQADLDRVDEVRAGVDAILVGAGTVRADDPRLVVRSEQRRAARLARGVPESPVKVTLTTGGGLDPAARFFSTGTADKLVYTTTEDRAAALRARLAGAATVVAVGEPLHPARMLADLAGRGIERLLVEGGGRVHTLFLTAGLVDELQIAFAPFFLGDAAAPRFVHPGVFPQGPGRRMELVEVRAVGDVAVLHYRARP